MLKLRLLTGPRAGRQLRVSDTKPVSVGRRKGRLRLHDSRVSKQHAEIYFSAGAWVLRDMGSVNGTYVNREKAKGLVELEPGDLVQMGRVLIKIVRADSIGMDTPEGMADDLIFGDLDAPAETVPEPEAFVDTETTEQPSGEIGDDIDLDALFAESDSEDDENDQSGVLPEADEPAPVPFEPVVESAEPALEPEDLTPIDVEFDEPDSGEDSFFHDPGEETDTSDGADLVPEVSDESPVAPALNDGDGDNDDDLFDLSSDSPVVQEVQDNGDAEEDPFLGRIDDSDAGEDSSSDLISLEDEEHIGPRSAGTTLLTAEHHDEYPDDIPDEAEHVKEFEDGLPDEPGDLPEQDPEEEPEDELEDELEDDKPALVGLHLDQAPPQQPELPSDEVASDAGDESVAEDAADDAIAEEQPQEEDFDAVQPDEGEEPAVDESPESEPVEDDPVPAFDIDAAFDALSEGLEDDDTLDVPSIDGEEDQAPEAASAVETLEPEAAEPEPLAGSQLDVGYIKDALAKLEEQDGDAPRPESNGSPNGESPTPDQSSTGDDTPPTRSPLSQQSPPPGINSTSIQPPQEPGGSTYRPNDGKRTGWFFSLLLFLLIGGVGGWFISQHYDSLITGRDDNLPNNEPAPPAPLAVSPGQGTPDPSTLIDPVADPGVSTASTPPASAPDETDEPVAAGTPDPFAAGPSVIGGEALAGITGGVDGRPLDAPRLPGTQPNRPSPIAQPTQPGTGGNSIARQPGDTPLDPGATPVAPPVDVDPARIVFLIDASGSLVDSLPQMLVWLNEALQTIESGEQFAVFYFKSGKAIGVEPAGLIKPTRDALLALSENWLNPIAAPVLPSGRSNPAQAIAAALKLEPTDLYLLSDESFAYFAGDTTSQQALALVTEAIGQHDVRVHGVQFFYRDQGSVLETLANRYEGTFEFVREKITPDGDPIDLLKELGGE